MAPPVPPKPQPVTVYDDGAIIAWHGTYPTGTTFTIYWNAGSSGSIPSLPYSNIFQSGLKARTGSVRAESGVDTIPKGMNIYVSVTSNWGGQESAQSEPLFLSICNATQSNEVSVGRDYSDQNKMLLTDEKGRIFVTTDAGAPIVVDETTLTASDPQIIPVGVSAIELPSSPLLNRKMLVIQNQGTTILKLGLSGSELYKLDANQTLTFTVGSASSIFGVRDSGTGDVCIWEFS